MYIIIYSTVNQVLPTANYLHFLVLTVQIIIAIIMSKKKVFYIRRNMDIQSRKERIIRYLAEKHSPFNLFTKNEFLNMLSKDITPFKRLMAFYKCAAMEVETKFLVLDEEMSLENERNPIESIKTRIKSVDSLVRKMNRKHIPLSIDAMEKNIFDIAGVRVICSFPEDIYYLEKCLLEQDDVRLIKRKDYIKTPKPSGYRSLHLIIEVPIFLQNEKKMMKVEVQLRTIAMDFWATLEHKLRYKKNINENIREELQAELLLCSEASAALDMRMQKIREKIFRETTE